MKIMSARDAKNYFGEFPDSARREPVVVTRNDRPVGIMISIEDAADTQPVGFPNGKSRFKLTLDFSCIKRSY